jgi:hypothetical protein
MCNLVCEAAFYKPETPVSDATSVLHLSKVAMRILSSVICFVVAASVALSSYGQASSAHNVYVKVQAAQSGDKAISAIDLNATAEWTAGSTHEHGTAQLQAKADGSTTVALRLGQLNRTETYSKEESSRTCKRTDAAGKEYAIVGLNCVASTPWFAPVLITQAALHRADLFSASDDGEISKDGATRHQISLIRPLRGTSDPISKSIQQSTKITILCDPQTLLPSSLEYSIHPDGDDSRGIGVRVVFSDYRSVSGVMLPFHIEKYVNHSLQLTLSVTNALAN